MNDSIRLDWVVEFGDSINISYREVYGKWFILDTSNGLALIGYGATSRQAIDMAMNNVNNYCLFNEFQESK